ncbi:hypothetical protein GGS20DRAFT_590430 [Poronia punctata]|nr:hypothetical protein GGS20DRAFT_590430 [Poronia punctata]
MESPSLNSPHESWHKKMVLMVKRHDDECMACRLERVDTEKLAERDLDRRLERLQDTLTQPQFMEQAAEIYKMRDNFLAIIKETYDEKMSCIKERQQREKTDFDKAHHEAMAARSSSRSTSTTPPTRPADAADTFTSLRRRESRSSSVETTLFPNEVASIQAFGKLQKSNEPREAENTSSSCASSDEPLVSKKLNRLTSDHTESSRTVTFDEVYQQGQALHKDIISEFPHDSGNWYIVKCEQHQLRFNLRPLQAAAKHMNARCHNNQSRSWALAVQELGYRVIDCTKELAEMNNKHVETAMANGYKPKLARYMGKRHVLKTLQSGPVGAPRIKKDALEKATQNISPNSEPLPGKGGEGGNVGKAKHPGRLSSDDAGSLGPLGKMEARSIEHPKMFHIYFAYWKPDRCVWPVMILGWDDQIAGGLEGNLASTGLLDKEARPPKCYTYRRNVADNSADNAIVGWAAGFEAGGPKVSQRKFPVMFFDRNQSVAWISARCLSKFPLYSTHPPAKHDHPFNAARRWVAKMQGFDSWKAFEKTHNSRKQEGTTSDLNSSHPSPTAPAESSSAESDSDDSASVVTDATEKELQLMRETAGEIPGDEDYNTSDTESSEEEEEDVDVQGTDALTGRPWAFYGLRNTETTSTARKRKSDAAGNDESSVHRDEAPKKAKLNTARSSSDRHRSEKAKSSDSTGSHIAEEVVVKTTSTPMAASRIPQTTSAPPPPSERTLTAKPNLRPPAFELSSYSKGHISWKHENQKAGLQLHYDESGKRLEALDCLVEVVIDPQAFGNFRREEIPDSKGNSVITLLSKDENEAPTRLVFDRVRCSKLDIGKIQEVDVSGLRGLTAGSVDARLITYIPFG